MNEVTGTEVAVQPQGKTLARARLAADGHGVMAIVPRSVEEAIRYARGLAESGIVPDAYRYDGKKDNEPNINLVAMGALKALEIGFQVQTGLAFLLPINGRFTVYSDGAWALIQRSGKLASHTTEWNWPEGFDKHTVPLDKWPNEIGCTVRMWRVGQADPYIGTFTVGHARRAGLWNVAYRKPWITAPERMLFNRARAFAQRDGFADALLGLSIAEEVMDFAPEPKQLTVDNSALDDDAPPPTRSDNEDAEQNAEAYIAGLAMIATLSDLLEYQQLPNNQALLEHLRKNDDDTYNRLLAANVQRYEEIEKAAQLAEAEDAEAENEGDE